MYHLEAAIVRVAEVHGESLVSRGAQAIRETMAAYIDMKPHMDVVTHHTTVAGNFAMTRSQWLITGVDKQGRRKPRFTTMAWRSIAASPTAPGYSSWTIRSAPIQLGRSAGRPHTQ